jgi:hypothetical protein
MIAISHAVKLLKYAADALSFEISAYATGSGKRFLCRFGKNVLKYEL